MALCTDPFADQRVLTHSTSSKQKRDKVQTPPTSRDRSHPWWGRRLRPGWDLESAPSLDSSFRSLGPRLSGNTSGLQRMTEPSSGTLRPGHTGFPRPLPAPLPVCIPQPHAHQTANPAATRDSRESCKAGLIWKAANRRARWKARGGAVVMAEAAFPVLLGYRACGLRVRAVLFCTESERCCFSSPYNTLLWDSWRLLGTVILRLPR